MRCTQVMAIVAGLAALAGPLGQRAQAQMSPNGWIIKVEHPILAPLGHPSGLPQSTVITVCAKFDSAEDYAFAAGLFDFVASEGMVTNWSANMRIAPFDAGGAVGGPDEGTLMARGARGAKPGQVHFPLPGGGGILGDPSNPAEVWTITYTATDFRERFIDLATITDTGLKGFALYEDAATPTSRRIDASLLMEGSGRIQIIPAPGSIAGVGLAWLVIARRRR